MTNYEFMAVEDDPTYNGEYRVWGVLLDNPEKKIFEYTSENPNAVFLKLATLGAYQGWSIASVTLYSDPPYYHRCFYMQRPLDDSSIANIPIVSKTDE